MCGRDLPPDTRWRVVRFLNPRPPMCLSDLEGCYRGLRARLGLPASDADVAAAVAIRRKSK